ncbi:hypothetical protein [Dokdonia sp.]|uniref:hypothetical protein n=1 Tax=Dokdonia sp. TaxID=2024995 RepID=UPI003264BE70
MSNINGIAIEDFIIKIAKINTNIDKLKEALIRNSLIKRNSILSKTYINFRNESKLEPEISCQLSFDLKQSINTTEAVGFSIDIYKEDNNWVFDGTITNYFHKYNMSNHDYFDFIENEYEDILDLVKNIEKLYDQLEIKFFDILKNLQSIMDQIKT